MSNIIVTSATGLIGSHIAAKLRKQNHTAVVLDDLSRGFAE